ncbi:MAG: UpxY family transcription antiterminator [Bacteroidetes bacterium]|nr:MAG: UpxY family transcription antiterminator [Bacteroidota bacterium]
MSRAAQPQPINQLHATEARWFAVRTNYKREKLVKRLLDQKGIENYLPLREVTRRYTRKIRVLQLPLISCYIFVRIVRDQYVPVLDTPDVLGFIKMRRDLIAIPDEEIDLLRRIAGEGIEVEADPASYREGDWVEIIGGNLTGLQGRLVEIDGSKEFVVELENIGYALRMRIPANLLRKVRVPV